MIKEEELVWEIVNYVKECDLYHYRDCYNDDQEAFDNFYSVLKNSPEGIITELTGDITRISLNDNLNDENIKEKIDLAYSLIVKINKIGRAHV